ncbi:MAG TPA: prenyltransferase [Anaerolineales bacterium]|nr:prenyltransferase [Anaerolineales bacterium]
MSGAKNLWLFVRLSRPLFLLGGFLLYVLGLTMAVHAGARIDLWRAVAGQALVSAIQLSVHYSNEYFDVSTDTANLYRTPFSGGSGVLSPAGLDRKAALWAGSITLAMTVLLLFRLMALGLMQGVPLGLVLVALVIGLGYSAPPARWVATGLGEFLAAFVIAAIVPALAFSLQTGGLSAVLAAAVIPPAALAFSMIMTFDLPDEDSDRATGKRTLAVRLGRAATVRWISLATALGYGWLVFSLWLGMPPIVATFAALSLPLAWVHITLARRTLKTAEPRWALVTALALAVFALTASLEAVGFLIAANA